MEYIFSKFLIILLITISLEIIRSYVRLSHGILCLLSGIIIGPFGLNVIRSSGYLKIFAELGVLLLMFVIGLETSFRRLKQMKNIIFGLGVMHAVSTTIPIAILLSIFGTYHIKWILIIALTLSFSSTAVAIQILTEREELNSKVGKISFGILVLQDILAVLLFIIIGLMDTRHVSENKIVLILLVISLLFIIIASPRWISRIVNYMNSDFRSLFALAAVLGTSMITHALNLSADLGAFIIGICCAGTPWAHEIDRMIAPYRILTLSIFFILIGAEIDLSYISDNLFSILGWLITIIVLKIILTVTLMRSMYRLSWSRSYDISFLLTGCGEFSFVIFANMFVNNTLSEEVCNFWSTITGLSMIFTPIICTLYRSYFNNIIMKKYDKLSDSSTDRSDIYHGKINPALAPVIVNDNFKT